MKPRHVLLGLGLAGALALVAFGDDEPAPAPTPAEHAPGPTPSSVALGAPGHTPWIMRVLPRDDVAGDGGAADDGAFRSRSWAAPPGEPEEETEPVEPPPPSAPPLPFRYIGKALGAEGWEVYLADGDTVHVARDNDVIGTYRVTEIRPPSMRLVYLPLNQEQGIDIGAGE